MSKARDLANFISNPTVEATEIANGAITEDKIANTAVTAEKLHTILNLSSKTLTLANNHLSGDNIHGGVISDFQSTGIDDNATSTAVTIATSKDVTFTNNVAAAYFSGDGSQLTGLPPGYTNSDVAAYLANNDYDTATNIIAEISNSAPATLDTLNELAAALGDDANFSTTTSTALGNRLRIDVSNQSLTGTQKTNALTNLGITATVAELNYVDGVTSNIQTQLNAKGTSSFSGAYADLTGKPSLFSGTFDDLSSKTSGTGEYSTSGILTAGRGSGGVSLTVNDGYGNANITWNHKSGVPEQNGNAARIEVNTDSVSGAAMHFELKSNVTGGSAVALTNGMTLTEGNLSINGTLTATGYNNTNWDTAYGWGDHSVAGYISSFDITSQTDPKYLRSDTSDSMSGALSISGDFALIGNSADLNLRTGAAGQTAFINWQFNTTSTNYIQMGIDYDTRASTGWFIDSGYPITIDYTTSLQFKASGTNTVSMDSGGNLTNVGIVSAARARLSGTGDVTLSSTNHAFQIGADNSTNLAFDANEIQARNNGGTGTLNLNLEGGTVVLGGQLYFDNTSDSNYDVRLGTYYDYDAWFQVKDGAGVTRFSVGRDNNGYLGGAGSAGNRILTQADEGSGNGLDADTVDGIHGSSFLRSDASDTTTGSLTINGDLIVDEIRARSSQDLCITAGEARTHLTDSTYNDEYIRIAAESGVVAYASSDNLTSGLNRSMTIINTNGHTITGGTLDASAGLIVGRVSTTTDFHNANDAGSMSVRGNSTHPALISFHRAGAYAFQFGVDTDNHLKMGGWSIGNNTPHTWQNNGNYLATGNITAYSSDKRLKINVVNIPKALNKVMSLNGVTFDWKEEVQDLGFEPTRMHNEVGVLAQEVEAVLPQATAPAPFDLKNDNGQTVSKSGENYLTVQYEKIVPLLIEAIKEQQAQIEELKKKIQG